jgi:hypothetical protein
MRPSISKKAHERQGQLAVGRTCLPRSSYVSFRPHANTIPPFIFIGDCHKDSEEEEDLFIHLSFEMKIYKYGIG